MLLSHNTDGVSDRKRIRNVLCTIYKLLRSKRKENVIMKRYENVEMQKRTCKISERKKKDKKMKEEKIGKIK
jgi:hypothetical protein